MLQIRICPDPNYSAGSQYSVVMKIEKLGPRPISRRRVILEWLKKVVQSAIKEVARKKWARICALLKQYVYCLSCILHSKTLENCRQKDSEVKHR